MRGFGLVAICRWSDGRSLSTLNEYRYLYNEDVYSELAHGHAARASPAHHQPGTQLSPQLVVHMYRSRMYRCRCRCRYRSRSYVCTGAGAEKGAARALPHRSCSCVQCTHARLIRTTSSCSRVECRHAAPNCASSLSSVEAAHVREACGGRHGRDMPLEAKTCSAFRQLPKAWCLLSRSS